MMSLAREPGNCQRRQRSKRLDQVGPEAEIAATLAPILANVTPADFASPPNLFRLFDPRASSRCKGPMSAETSTAISPTVVAIGDLLFELLKNLFRQPGDFVASGNQTQH